ncbi:PTS sugar transporter subunit IIC [Desulfovibrio ferrophilus]|uniref:Uncharacterized protein n=1 Tax=Desulfovibrio ferrophilus TaxID=241368 RepID=A0A2Z6AWF7_9BACT|nr:PTS sugar transporter subunit IIC [Desulfovibrio ferrophilus]BBD07579.1 uncharacterized protein DFE_0853 [Desulfovibrio ferrophilus]
MVEVSTAAIIWILTATSLYTLFAFLRFSLNLGIVERPLVQGLVWGLLTGNVTLGVSVALVFELFWLDLIPAGTFIPPNAAAANLAALCLTTVFGFSNPAQVVFPILLAFPLAWISSRLEQAHRRRQDRGYNILQSWLRSERQGDYAPGRLIRRAITQTLTAYFLFFLLTMTSLVALTSWLLAHGLLRPPSEMFSWGYLWIGATLGGMLALRVPGAYVILVLGACGVAMLSLFMG